MKGRIENAVHCMGKMDKEGVNPWNFFLHLSKPPWYSVLW